VTEIPEQREPDWLHDDVDDRVRIAMIDDAEAGRTRADDIYEALRARFAKAWWDGYAAGVQDSQSEETTLNPWENP
jgi:hypothetical protein